MSQTSTYSGQVTAREHGSGAAQEGDVAASTSKRQKISLPLANVLWVIHKGREKAREKRYRERRTAHSACDPEANSGLCRASAHQFPELPSKEGSSGIVSRISKGIIISLVARLTTCLADEPVMAGSFVGPSLSSSNEQVRAVLPLREGYDQQTFGHVRSPQPFPDVCEEVAEEQRYLQGQDEGHSDGRVNR
ncbi:hypothetical protein MRX96_005188 [Rhipicephalus microplus]